MSLRQTFGGVVLGVLLLGVAAYQGPVRTQTVSPVALNGNVTSAAEGAMEGVVVTAQREGSTILTSVTTNRLGEYSFPRNRMENRHLRHHHPRRRLRAPGASGGVGHHRRTRARPTESIPEPGDE